MATAPTTFVDNVEKPRPPRFSTLADWLAWQEELHFTEIDLGLERCRAVAERLGLLKPDFTVISVSGTNGKGSSVTMLEMILRRSGYRTGKYTSPHLLRYNERICTNGNEVSDSSLCEAFERIDRARGDISLTYFEFGTLAALDVFQRIGVQIAIMEVGLGGRLDAVNILDADASLVTNIDLDHGIWLGNDRNSVGREKAGIFRYGKPAICSDPEPPDSVINYANTLDVKLKLMNKDYFYQVEGDTWNWQSGTLEYQGLARPSAHNDIQTQNAAGVLMLLKMLPECFSVSPDAIASTMTGFRLNGRFQLVPGFIPYVLDVAHNPQAAKLLARNLEKLAVAGKTHCIVGMLNDKDHNSIFKELSSVVDIWYVVDLDSKRAAEANFLADILKKLEQPVEIALFNSVNEALENSSRCAEAGDTIVITGSFLTVRDGINWLELRP